MAACSNSIVAPSSRRAFLAGLAALPVAPAAGASSPDPVLAMIAQEQAVFDFWMEPDGDEEATRRHQVYIQQEKATYGTAPTTWAGLAALLDLYVRREDLDPDYAPEGYILAIAGYARALVEAGRQA